MKALIISILLALSLSSASAQTTYRTLTSERPGYRTAETRYPVFKEKTPLALLANKTLSDWAQTQHITFLKESRESLRQKPNAPYQWHADPTITCNTPNLISVYFDWMSYTGGAHPMSGYTAFNFVRSNGKVKQITLGDLFRPGSDYQRLVTDLVMQKLDTTEGADWVKEGEVKSLTAEQLNRFSITPEGLTFLINHYEAGPYAAGRFEIKLSLAELGPDFKRSLLARNKHSPVSSRNGIVH